MLVFPRSSSSIQGETAKGGGRGHTNFPLGSAHLLFSLNIQNKSFEHCERKFINNKIQLIYTQDILAVTDHKLISGFQYNIQVMECVNW